VEVVSTDQAPRAIGHYSQAVITGNLIFTAGQAGFDPATNEVVPGGIAAETDRALRNLAALLSSAGSNLQHVVKVIIFLVDMADFPVMNEVYMRHFGAHKPARSTVAVSRLPKDVRIEIDVVAVKP
jgi:2-iminobutanoate/2-iminopropanoate deaminase